MAFCPQCRSEFRAGFEVCKSCGDVPLVDELSEVQELGPHVLDQTAPVGLASDSDLVRPQEIEGIIVDLLRVFPLKLVKELQADLSAAGFASLVVPMPVTFPDMMPRFELRVMADQRVDAEARLRERWSETVAAEGFGEVANEASVDECPACGAQVPLDVDTCPECGLFVGMAAEDEDEAAESAEP